MKPGTMRVLLLVVVGGWLAACQSNTGSSESGAGKPLTSESGPQTLTKEWHETPIPFFISETVSSDLVQPILDSFTAWEQKAGRKLFDYQGRVKSTAHEFDTKNVVYWDTNPSPKGYLGETYFMTYDGGEMVEADIVFFGDPKKFSTLDCQNSASRCVSSSGKYDITTTALHEIGHLLGFDHVATDGAIMNPNFGLNSVNHGFDSPLLTALQDLYNPPTIAAK